MGRNNSFILENKIAAMRGYTDKRDIYKELDWRTKVIEEMIRIDMVDYYEVNTLVEKFQINGREGIPFEV